MKLEFGIREVINLMLKKRKQNIYYSSGVINHKITILALAKSYEKIVSGILIRNIYSQLGIINNFLSKQIYRLNCISEIRGCSK